MTRHIENALAFRPGITGAAWLFLALLFLSCSVSAQTANWNTTSGNWNNINNWDCAGNGVPAHCIPGAGYSVTDIAGDITLDGNVTVSNILGSAGSLTMSGQTLTATDPLGIQMIGGAVIATNGSVVNGYLITNDLTLGSSTVNGDVQAFNANITNSALGSLMIANSLTAADSNIGGTSNLNISATSSITNSTIGGMFSLNGGSTLTVDGISTVNASQTFLTQGSLSIQGGSTWNQTSTPFFMGLAPGTSGLAVDGPGSVLNLTNTALELGQIGDSSVAVSDFGSISATGAGGNFLIGLGTAFKTVSTMAVLDGGTASANNITVSGAPNGSIGLLEVFGVSSRVNADGELLVANKGSVTISDSGSLTANSLRIQDGTLDVINGTLSLPSGSVILVGSGGTGTVFVLNGGTADASGELVLGTSAGSSGTLTISDVGSTWTDDANVSIGEAGAGTLEVLAGGLLVTGTDGNGLSASLGTQSTGSGVANIQGGDWKANGSILIGAAGTGSLQLSQAGTVESGDATIGSGAGSSGTASVTDGGSHWTISGDLTVGSNGGGTLVISNGGMVTNVNATIGDKQGSSGTVNVVGLGSSWQNSGILTVGGDGAASLTIDAGSVTAGGAAMGSNFSPVTVDITNQGSLSVLGDVSIGGAAATVLTIEKGGTFDSGINATVGGAGGDTTVTITGTDSAWTLHGAGNNLLVDDKGTVFVMDNATLTSSSITVNTGGVLNGQGGHIVGNLINAGGTITPGDATGIMTVTGNFSQTSGMLLLEIDGLGPTQFDQLNVSGTADFTGGSIELLFGNGFVPTAGDSFDMLFAALGLNLSNVNFVVLGLPSDLNFAEIVGANGLSFDFTSNGGPPPPPPQTPEPMTSLLLGTGLLAMAGYTRLRSRMAKR